MDRELQAVAPRFSATTDEWKIAPGSNFREAGLAILAGIAVSAPVVLLGMVSVFGQLRARERAAADTARDAQAYELLVAGAPGPMLPIDEVSRGRELFATTCVACHGQAGTGVPGLGRNLVESDFVALQSDAELHAYIITGRPDAKPMPMPPRAGRPDLTDEDIHRIVVFMRGLQDPRRMPELAPLVLTVAPSEGDKAAALEAAGGDAELAAFIAKGNAIFHTSCVACHGREGVGIAGNGKALASNAFIQSLDEDGLFEFLSKGRSPTDPLNTTGIQMPPKGGNPAMSEDDILDVIAYLRTLQPASSESPK
ncbi:MAG: c-type cytochrome [Phycisphaeraceae bacterium]|nr:c-type cytochrome [Phycisphaeraceae bacterium]MCW5769663.1 c-type cytochrome [Phycisphaeraceae bacterium]